MTDLVEVKHVQNIKMRLRKEVSMYIGSVTVKRFGFKLYAVQKQDVIESVSVYGCEFLTVKRHDVYTWCVQVLRSPKEAFAAVMQSWRERCEKCVCLQCDNVEKLLHFQLPVVSSFFK